MKAMRTSTRTLAILFWASLATHASAQSWVDHEIINAPGGLCLDLPGNFDRTARPPAGTSVVVSSCNGREAQRWGVVGSESHDYQRQPRQLSSFAGGGIVARGGRAVIASDAGDAHYVREHIEIISRSAGALPTLCLTTQNAHPVPGERVLVRPCDGSPTQRFTIVRR
jgi:hypothetical protein